MTPAPRVAFALLLLVSTLAACGGPSFSTEVDDVSLPAGSTAGLVCYVRSDASTPLRFGRATYTAQALYHGGFTLTNEVEIRVYGRASAPADVCVEVGSDDVVLSDPLVLERDVPRTVEVGGAAYGGALAALVAEPPFWIGASVESDLGLDGVVDLTRGRITVGF